MQQFLLVCFKKVLLMVKSNSEESYSSLVYIPHPVVSNHLAVIRCSSSCLQVYFSPGLDQLCSSDYLSRQPDAVHTPSTWLLPPNGILRNKHHFMSLFPVKLDDKCTQSKYSEKCTQTWDLKELVVFIRFLISAAEKEHHPSLCFFSSFFD